MYIYVYNLHHRLTNTAPHQQQGSLLATALQILPRDCMADRGWFVRPVLLCYCLIF